MQSGVLTAKKSLPVRVKKRRTGKKRMPKTQRMYSTDISAASIHPKNVGKGVANSVKHGVK